MFLAFDTETTGLPDWSSPSDAPQQPHLVQLAMILMDDDLTERASTSIIIKPDGWRIPDDVAKIHGIDHDLAMRVGVPEKIATELYIGMMYGTGSVGVAHNIDFDLRIMRIALLRAGYSKEWQEERRLKTYCTMRKSSAIMKMAPTAKMVAAGHNKPKPPKLSEAYEHFFGEKLEGAHDALVDVRAAVRIFRHLNTVARQPEPTSEVAPSEEIL